MWTCYGEVTNLLGTCYGETSVSLMNFLSHAVLVMNSFRTLQSEDRCGTC